MPFQIIGNVIYVVIKLMLSNNGLIEEFVLFSKMYEAVLQILRVGKSLELIMSSYQLLIDLDKVIFVGK